MKKNSNKGIFQPITREDAQALNRYMYVLQKSTVKLNGTYGFLL